MNIVITDADTVVSEGLDLKIFEKFGKVTMYPLTDENEITDRIKDADIVLCNKTRLFENELSKAKNLKYIGLFATGYNNVDVDYCTKHAITVCNVPGYSTDAVAQHTFALILAIVNKVGEYNNIVKQGDWAKSRTFSYFPIPIYELSGKTIGIIGYGAIGKRVAQIAKAFNMNVLVNNRSKIEDESVNQVGLDELFENSDIVTMHCTLNKDSENLINKNTISKMKKGSIFINTVRGKIVVEEDLMQALNDEYLLGAGVDVLRTEPVSEDCPLLNAKNCFITPHIAWAALQTRQRLVNIVAENIEHYLNNTPVNTVNGL
ncbi:MAG: D-2-hydroxyacid dehydrogenase [Acutalibacteraceae bacterium]|nr:D-2-hydroxyacid dehydrogenase [Acutalibacteraceae bacterium]